MDKKPEEPKPIKKTDKEFETAGMFKEKDELPKTGLGHRGTLTLLK